MRGRNFADFTGMGTPPSRMLQARIHVLSAAVATTLIACLVLIGWTFDLEILKRILPGLVAINPMTAVAFLLGALSLSLFSDEARDQRKRLRSWIAQACALLVTLIAITKLSAVVGSYDVGIDRWLFSSKPAVGFHITSAMAPNTALNFLLVGGALLLLHSNNRRLNPWACLCALICGFESLIAVLGYAYGFRSSYGMASFIPMAFHTAVAFLFMTYGIMSSQANRGFLAIVTGNTVAGTMARRLLPAAILVPAVIGWLRLEGQRLEFFDSEYGVALYTVTNMMVFALLVGCNARLLFRTDAERAKADLRLRRTRDELEVRVQERTEQLSRANAELEKASAELEERVRERTITLAESEARLQAILDNTTAVVFLKDREGRYLFVNKQFEKLFGYSREAILGKSIYELFSKEVADKSWANDLEVFEKGMPLEFDEMTEHEDGVHTYISVKFPLFDATGKPYAVCGISTDITERKRAEEALRHSEERYRLLFKNNPYPIWVFDIETLSFLAVNNAAVQRYGYSREEFLSMTIKDIRPIEDIPALLDDVSKPSTGYETARTWRHKKKDGSIMDVEITSRPLSFGGRRAELVLVNDITERKRAEDIARESKRQLEAVIHANQLILDNSRDVICTVDETGRFTMVSAACETLWGYKPEELVGRPYIDMVYPEDRPKTNQAAAEVIAGRATSDFENRYIRKDSSLVQVMWSAYWSAADNLMFAVAHDITERARIQKALEQAKEEADRANHAKSEFLSRMSHELRTPMNAILGFAQLLEMDELNADQRQGVAHIIRGGRHLLELINEVLDISRIEAGRLSLSPEPVQLSEALRETIELVQPLAAEREVRLKAPPICDYYLRADRQRLKQVLINLLSNSIKYNRPGGSVTFRCENQKDRVRIFIKDTGIGIPPHRLGQLFTPFERLGAEQSTVEGTGLGLAVAKRLVEAMEGAIGVESIPSEGATFWVEFPLTDSPLNLANLADETLETRQVGPSEERCLLYIEDNLSNLQLIERIVLRRPAIKLLSARDGAEGLKMAREHIPDLILLDLNLPDIDGLEVLHRLRSDPGCIEIPVIVISADATNRQRKRLIEAGAAEYLTKPLNISSFLEILDQSLLGATPPS